MEANLYVEVSISPETNYILIEEMHFESEIKEEYDRYVEILTKFDKSRRVECFEGFKMQHLLINVKFDGRKRVEKSDVLKAMEKQELCTKVGESIFGGFYLKSDKLETIMKTNMEKRKELARKQLQNNIDEIEDNEQVETVQETEKEEKEMPIQVTLDANEFKHEGVYNGVEYNSLQVKSSSNGRIYFSIVKNGMRMKTMAKQMKLEDGKVFVSFGKQGKLFIGTYVDAAVQEDNYIIEENYKYEVWNTGRGRAACRVMTLDDLQIDKFDLIVDSDGVYHAWTLNTFSDSTKSLRKEIESKLNGENIEYDVTVTYGNEVFQYQIWAKNIEEAKEKAYSRWMKADKVDVIDQNEDIEEVVNAEETLVQEELQEETISHEDMEKYVHIIFCEASSEFVVHEAGIPVSELHNLFANELLDIIKKKLATMTEREILAFINFNCTMESIKDENWEQLDGTNSSKEVWNKPVKPNQPKTERELIETISNDKYTIEVYTWLSHDNIQCYFIKVYDVNTNSVINDMSDTVYLSRKAAYEFIGMINPIQETKQREPINDVTKQSKKVNETVQKLNIVASYAKINYKGDTACIVFTNGNVEHEVSYKYRRSWSHRKYIDTALSEYGVKPSWDFRYGWEYVS